MMRDVMQSAGLSFYAEIALILLFVAFAFTVVRTLSRRRGHYDDVANLPLNDDEVEGRDTSAGSKPSEV